MILLLVKILHITVAVFLILVVLLQTGKGAEMGAAFGGSSQTLFGGGGPAGFMAKLTTAAAICFMLTSLGLAYMSSAGRTTAGNIRATELPAQFPAEQPGPGPADGPAPAIPPPGPVEGDAPPAETGAPAQ
jgi:preprotein translocase subunit SecG